MKNLKNIFLFAFLAILSITNASNFKTEIIYFDVAKANINETQIEKLEKLSQANQVFLIGHTDSDGNNDYNKSLSKSRVNSVYDFLIKNGLAKHKIDLEYFGEEKPLNKNTDETQKAQNRRVEIKYIIDPLMAFEVEKQVFDINDNTETIIKGKNGTEIIVPANTFDAKNVKLEMKEYNNTLDILSSNLSTKANGELLETSGMVYLEATANGKKLEPQKDITIKFKKMSGKEDFQLFEGDRSSSDLDMNWNAMNKNQDEEEGIVLDKFKRQMSNFTVHDQLGTLLNEGKYSWYSHDKTNVFYNISASWTSWAQFFDYTDFYNRETHQCFEKVNLELELDSMGKVEKMKTNFDDKNHYCEKFYRKILTDNILADGLEGSSVLSIKFDMNFTQLDSISAFRSAESARQIALWEARQDSLNDFYEEQQIAKEKKKKAFYSTNQIITKTSKLGFINCDRFIRNIAKTDYVVNVSEMMNVRMVVKRFNSFYNGHQDYTLENKQVFTRIPLGEKVTLICTAYKGDKILLAIEETTIGKRPFSDFSFKEVSKEELKAKIESI